MSGRATLIDRFAAGALTAGALWAVAGLATDRTVPLTAVAAVVCTSAVAWRRAMPALAAVVALTAVAVYQVSGQDTQGAFIVVAVVMTCYSAGRAGTDRVSRRELGGVLAYGLLACTLIEIDSGFSVIGDLLAWVPLIVVPIGAGLFVRRLERVADSLREAESQLRDEQATEQARTMAEERTRVARDLHDVVAHCVTVMVIQAGAARLVADRDPGSARAALRIVVSSGREALADLRRVVGVRRRDDDPVLSVAQLEHLVDHVRDGGLDVGLNIDGSLRLPDDVALSVFRVVQEALTNVCKHAPSATTEVDVRVGQGVVDVRIANSGSLAAAHSVAVSGHGLVGMRERVALHEGSLRSGPTPDGGFVVQATIPLAAPVGGALSPEVEPVVMQQRPARRRRLSAMHVDALFSAAWLAALEVEAVTSPHRSGPLALNVAAVGAMSAAGLIRRRSPFVFAIVVGLLALPLTGGIASPERASLTGAYALVVCAYSIAAYRAQFPAAVGLAVMLGAVAAGVVMRHAPAGDAFGAGLMAGVVWIVGRVVRRQRTLRDELEKATTRLAADRESRALVALYDERARIARDLHALVARLVTTMVVQAEVAEELLDTDPGSAVGTISGIEQTGRQALTQMRHMLGVLRNNPVPLQLAREHVAVVPGVLAGMPS